MFKTTSTPSLKAQKVHTFQERKMKRYRLWNISALATFASKRGKMSTYDDIKGKLTSTIVGCEVHFFGSRVMGLSSTKSDLDIFIDMSKN